MIKDKETFASTVTLQHDPRSTHTAAHRALQQATVMKLVRACTRAGPRRRS
jgi:hypothetical protein